MTDNIWDNRDNEPFSLPANDIGKKNRNGNLSGFTEQPTGPHGMAQDLIRQNHTIDRPIEETATPLPKTEPVPKTPPSGAMPDILPDPQPERGSHDIRRDDTNSLKTGVANEACPLSPIQPLKENYPDEKRKPEETAANEGFTIRNREPYRQAQIESERNIRKLTDFPGQFMQENERENRFVHGIPAEGERHDSVFGNYLDMKSKSDNAMQEDWGKSIQERDNPEFGQGLRDIYHKGAQGTYNMGNNILSGVALIEDHMKNPYNMIASPWNLYPMLNQKRKAFIPPSADIQYKIYKQKKALKAKAQEHEKSLSQDYRQADIENPGYMGVREAATFVENIPGMLLAGAMVGTMGPEYELFYSTVIGAVDEYTGRYDREMDKWMAKPEREMWDYPEYEQAKREGKSEEEARFRVADPGWNGKIWDPDFSGLCLG